MNILTTDELQTVIEESKRWNLSTATQDIEATRTAWDKLHAQHKAALLLAADSSVSICTIIDGTGEIKAQNMQAAKYALKQSKTINDTMLQLVQTIDVHKNVGEIYSLMQWQLYNTLLVSEKTRNEVVYFHNKDYFSNFSEFSSNARLTELTKHLDEDIREQLNGTIFTNEHSVIPQVLTVKNLQLRLVPLGKYLNSLNLEQELIRTLVNAMKCEGATLEFLTEEDDIVNAYTKSKVHSCMSREAHRMRGRPNKHATVVFANNEVIKLAVMKDDKGEIIGRTLVNTKTKEYTTYYGHTYITTMLQQRGYKHNVHALYGCELPKIYDRENVLTMGYVDGCNNEVTIYDDKVLIGKHEGGVVKSTSKYGIIVLKEGFFWD